MSRVRGHLTMIAGCLISLVSFCLLPYLVVPYPSVTFAFTGLQLVTSGSRILLPSHPQVYSPPAGLWVLNMPFTWVLLLLVVLLLLAAVGDMWLSRQGEPARKAITRGILLLASLTFCFSLCSFALSFVLGFNPMGAHGNTIGLGGTDVRGSLVTPGFGGLVLGLIVALIGSMMTLRTKGKQGEGN